MFESIMKFLRKMTRKEDQTLKSSKDAAKERLHLVLMQDRANVSADFLDLMKQEIIEVIKKYIDVDENAIDVRLTNKSNEDGTTGAPVLYANIPVMSVKEEAKEEARKIKAENDIGAIKKEDTKKSEEKKEEIAEQEKETSEVIEKAEEIVEEIKSEEDTSSSEK